MAKKISEFLMGLARKAGVELSQEQQDFINGGELGRIDLDDSISTPIDNSLISLKDAKNNHSEIRNFYHKQVYDGFDASLTSLMEELELDDNGKNAILTERNTNKRLPLLVKMVKDLEQRKANADKPDKAAINKQIDDLNAAIRTEKTNGENLQKDFDLKLKQFKIDGKKQSLLSGYKTIYDELDPEVKYMTLINVLNKNLQDNNADVVLGDGDSVSLLKKDGTNYFGDNNQQVNLQQFIESTLSRNNLLVTTPKVASQALASDNPNGQNPQGGNANGNGNTSNHLLKSLNKQAIADLVQNSQNPVFGGGATR